MIPKRIYINKKTADNIGDYSAITASIRMFPNKFSNEVCYIAASSMWHTIETTPTRGSNFVAHTAKAKLVTLKMGEKTNWEKFCKWYKIDAWAYIEDLLP